MKIAVIGGGAAGMTFAVLAARGSQETAVPLQITIFERMEKCGRKLGITGKGRCNLTNLCSPTEFIASVPRNPKFLYAAINAFPPERTMELFEELGVPLKVERGDRVFPVSDRAGDVVWALKSAIDRLGVRITRARVSGIAPVSGGAWSVGFERDGRAATEIFDRVVVASGGASYPLTGSAGDGYKFAAALGIDVVPPKPSLVPLETTDRWMSSVMGLSLRNAALTVYEGDAVIYRDFGEMLFTHFGVSGPMILSASAHMRKFGAAKYRIEIDLKPALDEATLDARLLSDFEKYKNKNFANALSELLPSKLIPPFAALCGIDGEKKINSVTRSERERVVKLLKALPLQIKGPRPIEEAIITSGGVDVRALDPKTMECRARRGLYFIGEIIDVDAYTGGFNLQIAFATANAAARAIVDGAK